MKKTTKGALAAGAAAALLVGGAGTLAYWTDADDATPSDIASGSMDLVMDDCSATPWAHSEDDSAVVNVVPGDDIYVVCTGTLSLLGDHIAATVEVGNDPTFTSLGTLDDALNAGTFTASLVDDTGAPVASVTGSGDHAVNIRIDAQFPYGDATTTSINTSQLDTATLTEAILVNAVQEHDAAANGAP